MPYFEQLCEEAVRRPRLAGEGGIGTLSEKRLHSIIKHYLCPDEDYHEVGILDTRMVADVKIGNAVYEVQTGSFLPLKKKIAYDLEHTNCTVTVVHPIIVTRSVCWVDAETGEITKPRKSPKKGRAVDILGELYPLIPFLCNPRLRFRVLLLEATDYKLLNKTGKDRKRGAKRYERIPTRLLEDIEYTSPSDFATLIPKTLPERFTVKEFSTCSGIRGRAAYSAVYALEAMGLCHQTENPNGRAKCFLRNGL